MLYKCLGCQIYNPRDDLAEDQKLSSSQRMETPFPFYPEQTWTTQNTSKQKLETY